MYERIEEIQWCKVLMSEKSPASCGLVNSELGLWIDFLLTFFFCGTAWILSCRLQNGTVEYPKEMPI